jgi:hypothetical protein
LTPSGAGRHRRADGELADTAAGQGEGLGRLVVVNWAPDALGLVRALQGSAPSP